MTAANPPDDDPREAGQPGRDFFISYTGVNRPWAEWIAVELERAGYSTVVQSFDFRPGSDFLHEMHQATTTAARTITVLSPAYFDSKFTEAEWRVAFAKDPTGELRLLIPVRVQPCKPDGLLYGRVYVDLVGANEHVARKLLLAAVDRNPPRPTTAPFPGEHNTNPSGRPERTQAPYPGAQDEHLASHDDASTKPHTKPDVEQAPGAGARHSPGRGREFSLGPLHVPVRIIEGDGEHDIDARNVRVLVNPVDVLLPDELAEWRTEIGKEQARRKAAGERFAWNGASFAVDDLIVERVGAAEAPAVTLILKHSDYYTFLATQLLDRRLRGGATVRSRYLDGRRPRDVPDFMRSCFGLNMAVVTTDGWLLVARRGDEVHTGRGLWNSSANESLSRDKDSPEGAPPDLFEAARRGLREELHLAPHQFKLKLLAFHEVTLLSQWGALLYAPLTDLPRSDLEQHLTRGVEDRWEHMDFEYVRFEPDPVLRYLLRPDRRTTFGPAAPVLFYLSLVNVFGRQVVDAAARQAIDELGPPPGG